MDRYILLISAVIAAVSCIFSSHKQLQMLQQNSYFGVRYFKWLKESYSLPLCLSSFVFCLSSYFYLNNVFILQLILFSALLIVRIFLAVKTHKKSIKKLVVTARVKRLFAAEILVLLSLITFSQIFYNTMLSEILLILCFMLSSISPLLVYLALILTKPIEIAFSNYYINDAKKILRSHKNLKVIGITGSYGKTTTKFILNRILSEKFNTVCTPQSFNTPMGVVRTVREKIRPQTEVFICEMGAKNVGDIKEICLIAKPELAIITSVGKQHLDTFKSEDNVFKTKFELYDFVKHAGGKTFVNLDSEGIKTRLDTTKEGIVPFGNGTEYFADNISYGEFGSSFDLNLAGDKITVRTALLGTHAVADIVSAAAIAHTLGVSAEDIRFAIASLKATEHRLELKPFKNNSLLIDDAYNSNPEGCLEAVRVLSHFENRKKVIITPGLIELGSKEYECNYNLGLEAAKHCDIIILVGKNRSKPMMDAIATTDFPKDKVFVASSFREAMEIYMPFCDNTSIVLLENDLPDNYLN
jgi:UDP-N-acetylmuramoyl-tripeptide--D-alanyl-D-alanine ligase